MSRLRQRLAKAIVRAFREQYDLDVVVDPNEFVIPQGYWRSDPRADVYRWEIGYLLLGQGVGPRVRSYDTMTVCAHGVVLDRDPRHHLEYAATAQS